FLVRRISLATRRDRCGLEVIDRSPSMARNRSMFPHNELTTSSIRAIFADEISAIGGVVTEALDDGEHLLARSVLSTTREVRPKDLVQDGIALRSTGRMSGSIPTCSVRSVATAPSWRIP